MGLLAACLPPMGPLIRRASNPLDLYFIIRQNFASRSTGDTSNLKQLHSNERHPAMDDPKIGDAGHDFGHELDDLKLHSIQQSTGFQTFV